MEEPKKWYITRTGGGELHILCPSEEMLHRLSQIDTTVFPVAFTSREEAQSAADFMTRVIDKALATRPITVTLQIEGKEIATRLRHADD